MKLLRKLVTGNDLKLYLAIACITYGLGGIKAMMDERQEQLSIYDAAIAEAKSQLEELYDAIHNIADTEDDNDDDSTSRT